MVGGPATSADYDADMDMDQEQRDLEVRPILKIAFMPSSCLAQATGSLRSAVSQA